VVLSGEYRTGMTWLLYGLVNLLVFSPPLQRCKRMYQGLTTFANWLHLGTLEEHLPFVLIEHQSTLSFFLSMGRI
jgi:hypothetical protein